MEKNGKTFAKGRIEHHMAESKMQLDPERKRRMKIKGNMRREST